MSEYTSSRMAVSETAYRGPERRSAGAMTVWLMRMLDEVDHGMLLLNAQGALRHANQLGRRELAQGLSLQFSNGRVHSAQSGEQHILLQALVDANLGRRRLLTLGDDKQALSIAVVPLLAEDRTHGENLIVLILGRRQSCETLTIDFFARTQGLTAAEARVLQSLCDGLRPKEIARQFDVAISTIRSQISSIRTKTQTNSIRDLVGRVTTLPPMTPAMKSVTEH